MKRMPTVIICASDSYTGYLVESALTRVGARCVYYPAAMDMLRCLDAPTDPFDYIVVEEAHYGLAKSRMFGEMVSHLSPDSHVFLLRGAQATEHGFDQKRLTVLDLKSPMSDVCRGLTDKVTRDFDIYSQALMVA